MNVDIQCSPAYAMAYCYLAAGESVKVESGAMVCMSDGLSASASAGPGGAAKGLLRKAFGGESFFMGKYTADVQDAMVAVAPRYPGDIAVIDLEPGRGYVAESGSLLALSEHVEADVRWAGLQNIVMREGATMLHLTGRGKAVICSYGGFQRFDLHEGQRVIVDTGHMVAYSDTMKPRVGPLSGIATSMATGEGLVAQFTGPRGGGSIFIQTRAEDQLRSWVMPHRSQNRRG